MCQSFQPENVPIGVYTHINFAFASIDPNTFAVVPADSGDVDLYTRITNLKKQDQALKVYIAIGGWTFNDPGPTAKTFSNLVGSIANQQAFFRSTYNFDGVDIDWEYPVADDRSGSPEDYANYPAFLRNLKLALLASSGGRSGVTVTLPVSYWYLQNFDISSMEPWVDWFNVMSYDLHGLWDKDNKWLGPFLNSHTNLTEISEYLDLLWRNDIPPSKVNLGLAFYTRTFVASDPGCMQPACLFDAVGSPGPCTNNAGTLSNAELTNMVRNAGVTPTLDKDAAVQIAAVGRNWITYDDAESWALKLDFARGVCLGGVMVWAISEDYTDGTYSKQLQSVTQYRSPSVISNIIVGGDGGTGSTVDGPTSLVLRNQCMWANCGQSCPAGYSTVPRKDNSGSGIMNDGSRCRGGQLRTFCCPANERIPTCGWYDFNNGKCGKKFNSVCPAGSEQIIGPYSTEVGSTGIACNNGGFQVACCETKPFVTTDLGYASCQWDGTPPDCNDNRNGNDPVTAICRQYDSEFSYALFASPAGDGAVHCNGGYDRMYCCNPPTTEAQWLSCSWVFPNHHDDGFCEAYCPAGTVRLAMKDPEVYFSCSGNQGGWAYCCTPMFLSEAENDDETGDAFSAALVDVVQNGCDWTFDSSSPISRSLETFFNTSSGNSSETSLEKRGASSYNCELAYADTYNMLGTIDLNARIPLRNGWDDAMQVLGIDSLPATVIAVIPNPDAFRQMDLQLQVVFVKALLSMVPELSAKVSSTFVTLVCPWWWVADLGLTEDPDDGGLDPGDPYQRRKRDMLSMEELPIEDLSVDELPVDELPVDELPVDELPVNELPVEEISKETKKTRSADPLDDVDLSGFLGPFNLTDIGELFKDIKRGLAELQERFENDLDALSKANADVDVVTEPEELLRSIEERAQTGSSRSYKVTSQKYNTQQWPPLTVRSSPYPNGDGGDSLIDATNDNSRYIVVSKGCGPTDYTLVTNAAKGASNKWVSEHILELQTIPRFLTALLDGQLAAVPSMDIPSEVFTTASTNTVRMFTQAFQTWTHETGNTISPADRALRYCGSTTDVDGMVVADASLNAIKGRVSFLSFILSLFPSLISLV
ncbi:hypothetical protein SBRCBS47491_004482 [Sporothrix bragantina]|uniref:chitinase n=1 Tax=Sporothrix bragantina TaxID=671064 RepID=A0ABP0BNT2_9PEZI